MYCFHISIISRNFAAMSKKRYIFVFLWIFSFIGVKAQYNIQCEDTCDHVHGLDMSHYQGDVWWETVATNSNHKLNYVYLKATEGSSLIDQRYYENIQAAKRNGMNVGSYLFTVHKFHKLNSCRTFGHSVARKIKT